MQKRECKGSERDKERVFDKYAALIKKIVNVLGHLRRETRTCTNSCPSGRERCYDYTDPVIGVCCCLLTPVGFMSSKPINKETYLSSSAS